MSTNNFDSLTAYIAEMYQASCELLDVVEYTERYKGRALWSGQVGIFRVARGDFVFDCFAWDVDPLMGLVEPVVMIKSADIPSPGAAVRLHLMNLSQEFAAA